MQNSYTCLAKKRTLKAKCWSCTGKVYRCIFKYIKMDNFYPNMPAMNVLSLLKAFFPVSELGW